MADRVEVEGPGGAVAFEVDRVPARGVERISTSTGEVMVKATKPIQEAIQPVVVTAESVLQSFQKLGLAEIEVEFGIKIDAQAGAIFAKTGVEGHFTVSLMWKHMDSSI